MNISGVERALLFEEEENEDVIVGPVIRMMYGQLNCYKSSMRELVNTASKQHDLYQRTSIFV